MDTIVPKGKLIPIGGNEAHGPEDNASGGQMQQVDFFKNGILQEVLLEMKGPETKILVIPAASDVPKEMAKVYIDAFKSLGCKEVEIMYVEKPEDTDRKENLKKLEQADGIMFTGGDQSILIEKFADSDFCRRMVDRYWNEGFVIAGTSAGAAAMARLAIKDGKSGESLIKGMVETEKGLALVPEVIIDTHFMQRSRLPRLTEALLRNPGLVGLGLCADTGVVITEGNRLKPIGSGVVTILETDAIQVTNYHLVKELEPVYLDGLRVRMLAAGARYLIRERKFIPLGSTEEKTHKPTV
ncbi:cyanophycinase [Larkinella soli]|uniref:cyanophycinase n=1 Tax=Larkinella soli TaxID=1770527 RepID=UPI000FFBF18F|nr:cyanophycinase [Larkinella soli]